jgi:hypothetical protein
MADELNMTNAVAARMPPTNDLIIDIPPVAVLLDAACRGFSTPGEGPPALPVARFEGPKPDPIPSLTASRAGNKS